MKTTIVGGNCGTGKRSSSIVNKIATHFDNVNVLNGCELEELPKVVEGLTLWMPNIDNSFDKYYPSKTKGTCLIVSKVVRHDEAEAAGEHKFFQAVNRIFKMHGNAVIAIEKNTDTFVFNLIDALGNIWVSTSDIKELTETIKAFVDWSNGQIRKSIPRYVEMRTSIGNRLIVDRFMELVRTNAKRIMDGTSDRYFGNCSTRCMSSFPSVNIPEAFLFSPRNVSKLELETTDMVYVTNFGHVGERKPSVDTPVQMELYKNLPNIKFMIHGHAFFDDVETTKHYFPCGDMREADEVLRIVDKNDSFFALNLKNHGYLVGSEMLDDLSYFLSENIATMQPFRNL